VDFPVRQRVGACLQNILDACEASCCSTCNGALDEIFTLGIGEGGENWIRGFASECSAEGLGMEWDMRHMCVRLGHGLAPDLKDEHFTTHLVRCTYDSRFPLP